LPISRSAFSVRGRAPVGLSWRSLRPARGVGPYEHLPLLSPTPPPPSSVPQELPPEMKRQPHCRWYLRLSSWIQCSMTAIPPPHIRCGLLTPADLPALSPIRLQATPADLTYIHCQPSATTARRKQQHATQGNERARPTPLRQARGMHPSRQPALDAIQCDAIT
jgi:hypothetical protein